VHVREEAARLQGKLSARGWSFDPRQVRGHGSKETVAHRIDNQRFRFPATDLDIQLT
jgi:hypothetical protein